MSDKPEFRICHECGHCESQQGRNGECLQDIGHGDMGEECGCPCYYWDDDEEETEDERAYREAVNDD